jgi:YD repeat-containing protein
MDPELNRTSFTYDLASRRISQTNPRGHTSTTVYDADGRVIAALNPLGFRTTAGIRLGLRQAMLG